MMEAIIIKKALSARTLHDAERVQELIIKAVGNEYQRPVGDRWNNSGMLRQGGGSYDHKVIENVTNMQDAILERLVLAKCGSRDQALFNTPHDAANEVFIDEDLKDSVMVTFFESDPPANRTKKITAVFRDQGCGMTARQVPKTIFALGSAHKEGVKWLQGAFGLGGASTYNNAKAVVLVTRRAPELLAEDEEDQITVAVLLWEPRTKLRSIYYLVTQEWQDNSECASPYAVHASAFPEFQPGTHLALISYGVEGFYRARSGGDDRTFEAVLNTRLFNPLIPVSFSNQILSTRKSRTDTLKGLSRRLMDNPREERRQGKESLPFHVDGKTHQLQISYYVFSKPGDPGNRRNFVAYDHAVIFTSNGQAHYHWTPAEFRWKTKHNKLYDRIFVVVETDSLPIEIRSSFFTADRSGLVHTDLALKLEEAVIAFINEWDDLRRINGELIREAISSRSNERPTINIAKQISRALTMKGFSLGPTSGTSGGGTRPPGSRHLRDIELHDDPTYIEGPKHVIAEEDKTKFITYTVDAKDGFIPARGQLEVMCNHPDIGPQEITVGELKSGRIRVSIAIPPEPAVGEYALEVLLDNWLKKSGGLGHALRTKTTLEIVKENNAGRTNPGEKKGKSGPSEGALVALRWTTHEKEEGWGAKTVGDVLQVPANVLAEENEEYKELKSLGEMEIPTLLLNEGYFALKKYLDARAHQLTEVNSARDRYAVGVGVGLCMIHQKIEKIKMQNNSIPDEWIEISHDSLARSVLSMMPEFDKLMKEAGVENS